MSRKIMILVEGQTEERFVKNRLSPYLADKNVHIIPTIIKTKRVLRGPDHKGGVTTYEHIRDDLRRMFTDSSADLFTTMIDYYGLPDNFPGKETRPPGTC